MPYLMALFSYFCTELWLFYWHGFIRVPNNYYLDVLNLVGLIESSDHSIYISNIFACLLRWILQIPRKLILLLGLRRKPQNFALISTTNQVPVLFLATIWHVLNWLLLIWCNIQLPMINCFFCFLFSWDQLWLLMNAVVHVDCRPTHRACCVETLGEYKCQFLVILMKYKQWEHSLKCKNQALS